MILLLIDYLLWDNVIELGVIFHFLIISLVLGKLHVL